MAAASASTNKAKIARRVIEVLEYFDDNHPEATVMDIVRRYNRPQSSTSELLSSLVDLGLLYKEPYSRCYRPTARAALLGSAGQPETIRDGRLLRLIDRLVAQTGLTVALFGRVRLRTQVILLRGGDRASASVSAELFSGLQAPLHESAAGLLLLSTEPQQRRAAILRRLNAEAPDHAKFAPAELMARIDAFRKGPVCHGAVGFGSSGQVLATLLPGQPDGQPMAVGLVYGAENKVNPGNLAGCLVDATAHCAAGPAMPSAKVEQLFYAA